jgi:hypothetical protein
VLDSQFGQAILFQLAGAPKKRRAFLTEPGEPRSYP